MNEAEEETPATLPLQCWFCLHPAVTIGFGFAVCGGREETPVNCTELARNLFRRSIRERLPE